MSSKPLKGISKLSEDAFRINCECTSDDHTLDCWIEVDRDEDVPMVTMEFYLKTWTPPFCGLWDRICTAYEILVKGVTIREHGILLDREAAKNVVQALNRKLKEAEKEVE